MEGIRIISLLAITETAALFDLYEGRIPNGLTVCGLAMGFVWQLFAKGLPGVCVFFCGALLPALVFGLLFYFRMIGAGDIKLLMAAGGFLGVPGVLRCILLSLFAAGLIALFLVIRNRSIVERFTCLFTYIREICRGGKWSPYMVDRAEEGAKFCFAVPVAIAVLFCI